MYTTGKDTTRASRHHLFLRRHAETDLKLAEFVRTQHMTMMPCVSAAGNCRPTFFVFKGSKMPYRQVLCVGRAHV